MAVKDIAYKTEQFRIAYHIIDNNATKSMVFLHGWGSNRMLMESAFGKYFSNYNHIYIDLPGFGASANDVFLTTNDYAGIIDLFLMECKITNTQNHTTKNKDEKNQTIIVGHSFGGKVALLLNREIILLSSAGILLPKPLKIRMKIALAKMLKKMPINFNFLRADDARDLSPVMYEVFKQVVQEDFSLYYKNFKQRTTIFWGRDDKATTLESYNIICELMPHAKSHVLTGDHYFFLQQGGLIDKLYHE